MTGDCSEQYAGKSTKYLPNLVSCRPVQPSSRPPGISTKEVTATDNDGNLRNVLNLKIESPEMLTWTSKIKIFQWIQELENKEGEAYLYPHAASCRHFPSNLHSHLMMEWAFELQIPVKKSLRVKNNIFIWISQMIVKSVNRIMDRNGTLGSILWQFPANADPLILRRTLCHFRRDAGFDFELFNTETLVGVYLPVHINTFPSFNHKFHNDRRSDTQKEWVLL